MHSGATKDIKSY